MKVLGLTCGRKASNTEILVKEALMGAEENGAEAEIVRFMDLNIKPEQASVFLKMISNSLMIRYLRLTE